MKRIISLFGLLVVMAVSCVEEQHIDVQVFTDDPVFYATMEDSDVAATRAYVNDQLRIRWDEGDHISIFNKNTSNREYAFQGQTGDNSGEFRKVPSESFFAGNPLDYVYAVYPYSESTGISDDGEITLTLPAEQSYRENSFGPGANTMIAVADDNDLMFKNLCGYLMLKLYGDDVTVKSISLKGNDNEPLAGKATVTASIDGNPSLLFDETATDEITLTFDTPVTLGNTAETATIFWLVVPPTTFEAGITLTVTDDQNGILEKSTTKSLIISRNTLAKMAAIKAIPLPSNNPIVFADPVAKYACVEKFDSNSDGEVSYAEAAVVTSLRGLFDDWNTVTHFDEIKFFKGVKSTEGVFNGLSKLESISIPNNILTLGTFIGCTSLKTIILPSSLSSLPSSCFSGCSSLISVTLPSSISTIPEYCFVSCRSLASVSLPSSVVYIGPHAFKNCSSLNDITLPEGLTTIDYYAFSGCSSLSSIVLPSSLVLINTAAFEKCSSLLSIIIGENAAIESHAFRGCTSLTSVELPPDLSTIPVCCFENCDNLASVIWPDALTTIEDCAFRGCTFKCNNYSLVLPDSVTTIGSEAFGYLHHLVIPSSSLVSINRSSFVKDYTCIYVQSDKVELYKVRSNWSSYANRLLPIQDYPAPNPPVFGIVGNAVDLGLSVKWASWNIGASSQEEHGEYFAWGETNPKWEYDWTTYKWCEGTEQSLTKYCTNDRYGVVDNLTVLDLTDDAARTLWGSSWRIPTKEEIDELRDPENCTWSWSVENGVSGYRIISKKPGFEGVSVFLPASGVRVDSIFYDYGSWGNYLSSSLFLEQNTSIYLYRLPFNSNGVYLTTDYGGYLRRCYGYTIRPVYGN